MRKVHWGALCAAGVAVAAVGIGALSPVARAAGGMDRAQEKLVWSDEFNTPGPPDPANWTYDTGGGGFGNHELETYCAPGSDKKPCDAARPNAFIGKDGYLHIVARRAGDGLYTSARMKTQGLRSFLYGRIEARIRIPRGQGMWPAFWTLGDAVDRVGWPACGEVDILESIGKTPGTIYGSVHGRGFTGSIITTSYSLPSGQAFADGFRTYGILWSPGKVQFYVDDPAHVYATETPANLPKGAVWPFDGGKQFLLLNLAVGGDWPGNPDAATQFPQEMLVDWVRVWQGHSGQRTAGSGQRAGDSGEGIAGSGQQ